MAYPTTIDSFTGQIGSSGDQQSSPSMITLFQNITAALIATQTEMGTNPSGTYATVKLLLEQATFQPGDLKPSAVDAAPTGWLDCNGQLVSRVTYAALFTAIGVIYGAGDGSTTFNVPDIRGRTVVGGGAAGSGLTARAHASTFGAENHQLTSAEMPVHNHNITPNFGNGTHTHSGAAGTVAEGNVGSAAGSTFGLSNAGSGGVHNNMQPSIAFKMLIKT